MGMTKEDQLEYDAAAKDMGKLSELCSSTPGAIVAADLICDVAHENAIKAAHVMNSGKVVLIGGGHVAGVPLALVNAEAEVLDLIVNKLVDTGVAREVALDAAKNMVQGNNTLAGIEDLKRKFITHGVNDRIVDHNYTKPKHHNKAAAARKKTKRLKAYKKPRRKK